MEKSKKQVISNCITISQLQYSLYIKAIFVISLVIFVIAPVSAVEISKSYNTQLLKALNPYSNVSAIQRKISNTSDTAVASKNVEDINLETKAPAKKKVWIKSAFKEHKGILKRVRNQMSKWEKEEEYVKVWNLKSTGLHKETSQETKKEYLMKNALNYFEGRLVSSSKKAAGNSTLAKAGKVHKALRPNSNVNISKKVNIKFKAVLVRGQAKMIVENPYLECETQINLDGNVLVHTGKNIEDIGLKTDLNYNLNEEQWIASATKNLNESISAQISSSQSTKKMFLGSESDKVAKVMYTYNF